MMERGNTAVWAIKWDTTLLATLYNGIICSGLAYYIQGLNDRVLYFVTAFSPLDMIFVAIMVSIILAGKTHIGRVLGAIVILAGRWMFGTGKYIATFSFGNMWNLCRIHLSHYYNSLNLWCQKS